jgi:signal transduction histidine kinase
MARNRNVVSSGLAPGARNSRAPGAQAYAHGLMNKVVLWTRGLPAWVWDAAVAVGVAVVAVVGTAAQGPLRGYTHLDWLAYVLAAAGGLVLVWRRRYPTAVFAATTGAAVLYEARGYRGGPALIAVVVAVYWVALLESRRRSLALAVIAAVALGASRLIFTSETLGSIAVNAVGFLGAALFLGWAVANRRAFVNEIRDRADRAERTREEEARWRVDDERLRIARELHDVVAHAISTINVQAGVGEHVIATKPEEAARALSLIKQTSRDALRELRAMLNVLRAVDEPDARAPAPGLGHVDALIATSIRAGIPTDLIIRGDARQLPATVDLTAYRIVQESLTNVLRHGAPARATITIVYEPELVTITVGDDGTGAAGLSDGTGHGITGMRERAGAVGGTLTAGPRPEGGFEVTAVLPLRELDAR